MIQVFIPLLCVISMAGSNDLYPSYTYKANMACENVVSYNPVIFDYYGDYVQNTFSYSFSADLYYNDYTDYYVKNIQLSYTWDFIDREEHNETFSYTFNVPYTFTQSNIDNFRLDLFTQRDVEEYDELYIYYAYNGTMVSAIRHTFSSIELDSFEQTDYYFNFGTYLNSQITNFIDVSGTEYGDGYNQGYGDGYAVGQSDGYNNGYQVGYGEGINYGQSQTTTAVTIFTGICEVGLLPVNVFLGILNFEVFGINIGGLVASLMTVAIVVIVIRVILGSKSND